MKLIAISQRGTYRDFIDVFYLIKEFSLTKLLELTQKKYPTFDVYNGLRGLLYFTDADAEDSQQKQRIALSDKTLKWDDVKKEITNEVREYQKLFLHDA